MSLDEHRQPSDRTIRCAVLTVSDSRTIDTDRGGALVAELLTAAEYEVVERQITPDDPQQIAKLVATWTDDNTIDAVLLTGGTGISRRDQTCETISGLLTKPLPGYGELFRMLSYEEIGAAAMLSRAVGGVCGETIVMTMPGSTAAVRLAMQKLIIPELSHLVREATKTS